MINVGFSTGALAKADFRHALKILKNYPRSSAIELSALREQELKPLIESLDSLDLKQYSYVAVHAPSYTQDEGSVIDLLNRVKELEWSIVVHPDCIQDWSLWRQFGNLLCIENMDKRKPIGRSVDELRECFMKLPDASLCLDLGHARQYDPTMTEAYLIIKEYASKLRQVHLSEVNTDSSHSKISYAAFLSFKEIAPFLLKNIPFILETPVTDNEISTEITLANSIMDMEKNSTPVPGRKETNAFSETY
jgi:hypothetical protein